MYVCGIWLDLNVGGMEKLLWVDLIQNKRI